ncbi:M23 family metallopeptidase [Wenxinia marina]|uniref:Membrane protein n=1 Tax=Wenxinia marina DSM 24838 TaxID=1123501 RepID=A0A0D0NJZ3_9RHOB|nr:Membrane protein [Wenxinia marina DSM 24838]GGL67530.1 peptidase M23 [Wenxinia marina]
MRQLPAFGPRITLGTARLAIPLAALTLSACNGGPMDLDLRSRADGFTTATAAAEAANRPRPDERGVITYPNYQVVVARRDDTVTSIAGRLGLDPQRVAEYNGVQPDTVLRRDEIIALPDRVPGAVTPVAAPAPATAPTAAPAVNVTELASAAIDRAAPAQPAAAAPAASGQPFAPPAGAEPIRHQVQRGETAYILARRYGVPVRTIAEWNGLGPDLAIREGQQLLIPRGGTPAADLPVEVAQPEPGAGSVTPVPPSAVVPLPDERVEPAAAPAPSGTATTPAPAAEPPAPAVPSPDLGAQQTETREAQMVMPAAGSIIRDYAAGRNEGIDIGASAGAPVRAADAGTVAAITTNTEGIDIVVIRHDGDLLTVYTHLDNLSVARGDRVSRGQQIGAVRAGNPAFLHFEVRRGMESRDPTEYLP